MANSKSVEEAVQQFKPCENPNPDKEGLYNERISPLVTQIIDICREEGINIYLFFGLGKDKNNEDQMRTCTTCMPSDPSVAAETGLLHQFLAIQQNGAVAVPAELAQWLAERLADSIKDMGAPEGTLPN